MLKLLSRWIQTQYHSRIIETPIIDMPCIRVRHVVFNFELVRVEEMNFGRKNANQ